MGLTKQQTATAVQILSEVVGNNLELVEFDPENGYQTGAAVAYLTYDVTGYQNVYLNIQDITEDQLATFEEKKTNLINCYSFIQEPTPEGITRLGWY